MSLKVARNNAGLTQQQVADNLKINIRTLQRYEADKINIPISRLKQLAKLYKTKVDVLI